MGRLAAVGVLVLACSSGTFTAERAGEDAGGGGEGEEPRAGRAPSSGATSSSGTGGASGAPSSSGTGGTGGERVGGGTGGELVAGGAGSNQVEGWRCTLPYTWDDPACANACEKFEALEHGPAGFCYGEGRNVCACPNVTCDPCDAETCPGGMQCAGGGCFPPGELGDGESCDDGIPGNGRDATSCGAGLACGTETGLVCKPACL